MPVSAQLRSQREAVPLLLLRPRGGCTACSACRGVGGVVGPLLLAPAPLASLPLASALAMPPLPLAIPPQQPPLVL